MNVFNSLGSNYDLNFVRQALFTKQDHEPSKKLKSYLDSKYKGETVLVYKGREAIELALKILNLSKGSLVAINGYTCYAVYKAVLNAGYKIEYLDIEDRDLNFSPKTLEARLKKSPAVKAVIIQNTLGYPSQIEDIAKICRRYEIILIEDLAHSVGTRYKNSVEAGAVGDFIILSFSQDKAIDAVSGGALVIRNGKYRDRNPLQFAGVTQKQQLTDRLYPLFTYLIRATYPLGLGKVIHQLLKKLNLLSQPMGAQSLTTLRKLPGFYCHLAYKQFQNLQTDLRHRREIASVYAKELNSKILSDTVCRQIPYSTSLRFPIFVNRRDNLVQYLKEQGIFVSDIWYDAPIAPKKYLQFTDYNRQCPNAEKISLQILNLPTHNNVSVKQAKEITERINKWLKLQ